MITLYHEAPTDLDLVDTEAHPKLGQTFGAFQETAGRNGSREGPDHSSRLKEASRFLQLVRTGAIGDSVATRKDSGFQYRGVIEPKTSPLFSFTETVRGCPRGDCTRLG